jgi:hypothetical protein
MSTRSSTNFVLVEVQSIVADEGTVVVFGGFLSESEDFVAVAVAVDHRMAQPIADALAEGLQPVVEAEGWQILGCGMVVLNDPADAPVELEEPSDKCTVSDVRGHRR